MAAAVTEEPIVNPVENSREPAGVEEALSTSTRMVTMVGGDGREL
jgi:hypothetical protein